MRARCVTSAAVALSLWLMAVPAAAETRPSPGPGGGGGAYLGPNDDPTATAKDRTGGPGGGGGGGGSADPCHWEVVIEDDFKFSIYSADTNETLHSRTGRWLQYVCDGVGPVAVDGLFTVPEGGVVDPAALAVDALASIGIDPPAIRTSPEADKRLYVQIPTWLWLKQTWWKTYEATASAGRVTSTVFARPVKTAWVLGDGGALSCSGPGRPWKAGLPEDATDCSHTYRSSSVGRPGGTFSLEATVTLEVTWSSNTGAGDTLPSISRTSTVSVEVGEIQAIGTG